MEKNRRFVVVAMCDAYNARKHWHGEPVLGRNGATPTTWAISPVVNYEEAFVCFDDFARKLLLDKDDVKYVSEDDLLGKFTDIIECPSHDVDEVVRLINYAYDNWQGSGFYMDDELIYSDYETKDSFSYDTMTYAIEELDDDTLTYHVENDKATVRNKEFLSLEDAYTEFDKLKFNNNSLWKIVDNNGEIVYQETF